MLLPPEEENSSYSSSYPVGNPSVRRQSSTILSSVNPFHKLWLTSPAVLHGVINPASKPDSAWIHVFLHDHRSCRVPESSVGFTQDCSFLLVHLHPSQVLHRLQMNLCSTMDLHRLKGHSCLTTVCTMGCREICSSAWSTWSSSFTSNLGVCKVISLAYSHSSVTAAIVLQ